MNNLLTSEKIACQPQALPCKKDAIASPQIPILSPNIPNGAPRLSFDNMGERLSIADNSKMNVQFKSEDICIPSESDPNDSV